MSQIKVSDLTFRYDNSYELIFDHTSFVLDTDWKLGFIGRNGRGKTTLLQLLLGKHEYLGEIETSVQFEYFPYDFPRETTALQAVKESIAPFSQWERQMETCIHSGSEEDMIRYGELLDMYLAHDGYIIDELIQREAGKLALSPEILSSPISVISPGEQTKLKLAALFLKKNAFLLIDEPTNHLDMLGRQQLAEYLNGKKGFILVSHDRAFLNRCIDHVLSINRTTIEVQRGNYESWEENRQRREQSERDRNEHLKKDIGRLEEAARRGVTWADKVEGSKIGGHSADRGFIGAQAARMMKRAKSLERRREEAIEEKKTLLRDMEEVSALKMNLLPFHKERMIQLEKLSLALGAKKLFTEFSMEICRGERIALRGGNGCGKSTLLKLIMGADYEFQGKLYVAEGLKISYISQDTSFLSGSLRDYAKAHGLRETTLMTVLRQLDFPREHFEKPMEYYSEGQKKKVLLARSLSEEAHLFIWDEPLNYIDVISRIQLERVILEYCPTMLFVEHDETFSRKVATEILELG